MPSQETKSKRPFPISTLQAIRIAFEFGFVIAVPPAILSILGKRLDAQSEGTTGTLYGITFALAMSIIWLTIRIRAIIKNLS